MNTLRKEVNILANMIAYGSLKVLRHEIKHITKRVMISVEVESMRLLKTAFAPVPWLMRIEEGIMSIEESMDEGFRELS